MARIVFIGVGDVELTRRVASALMLAPSLRGELEIVLHDDDPGRLATTERLVRALDAEARADAKIRSVFDRRQALKGAGFVVAHLDVGGFEATLRDFEIPHRYGLRQTIGDTIGIGGVFRGLRMIPVLVELAAQMAEECPDAWLLSCSDPMAMTGWAVHEATGFERFAGLCHSVCDTHAYLADLVGRDEDEVSFLSAGLNHQSFVLRFEAGGRSLYPELDAVLDADPQLRRHVRAELYRTFGYFPTQSSEHAAEYVPWIMRHPDETSRLGVPVEEYLRRVGKSLHLYEETRRALSAGHPLLIRWQHQEPAAAAILAMLTGEEKEIYVNVANRGLIGNLPAGSCVEVPADVGAGGVRPRAVGDLPVQLAALNRTFLNVVELTVRAALDGERGHVYHAAMLDPNTAATLPLPAIERLCDELIEAHGDLLPPAVRA
ncbi:alpha-glucosidase/alpha-galactosidase [Nonomuraea fuscirosea]|uniref:Alpha-galactosidase n=1 Tax=Nonomuraea fuscirosea TaxID=1291556 RepID=A0A2T0N1L2_9ACTN|nr:alpha-glucosidase/alpha-galactosidase [Nonomuraea fuscirosea]PRX65874.1 alpha-galactosidase [Nonomuraea fuscirosea]WSA56483.1 alpha-glucosidase/alpha-galactosidase [Nonomuraea fuscirosea]